MTWNPSNISTGKGASALGVPGLAIAVGATSAGVLKGPQGYTFGWVEVANMTPWFCTVSTVAGLKTIKPYTADLVVPVSNGVPYVMSLPPGVSAAAPSGVPTCLQPDWYVAGGGRPDGTYPYSLVSQAVAAAISGSVTAELPDQALGNSPATINGANAFTFTIPAGAVFNSVIVGWDFTAGGVKAKFVGHTSGIPWIPNLAMGLGSGPASGFYVASFSSVTDPGGLDLTTTLFPAWTGSIAGTVYAIGSSVPLTTRVVTGAGNAGATGIAAAGANPGTSQNVVDVISGATLGGYKGATIRIYHAALQWGATAAGQAHLNWGISGILIGISSGAGTGEIELDANPNGVPLEIDLNTINVQAAANITSSATVVYSIDF